MENTGGRHPLAKAARHSEMNAFRHDVTQVMNCERCVVGDDRLRNTFLVSAPEGPADQVLVLAARKVAQTRSVRQLIEVSLESWTILPQACGALRIELRGYIFVRIRSIPSLSLREDRVA